MKKSPLSIAISATFFGTFQLCAFADDTVTTLPEVVVTAISSDSTAFQSRLDPSHETHQSGDSARLIEQLPGASSLGAGGVSSLPVLDGQADDRLKIVVNGMNITSACPNHMNPALSYIDPSAIATLDVFAGISPVSQGGDSTGGSIIVQTADPQFAAAGEVLTSGRLAGFYQSNGNTNGQNLRASLASENFSIGYLGSIVQGQNYKDGDGNEVRSTEFKSGNQQLTLAGRHGAHLLSLELGWQDIPYQGFPNQYMDMTSNRSTSLNLRYKGDFDWGDIVANTYSHKVRHKMDMLSDKAGLGVLTNGTPYAMPMDTSAVDRGYNLRADIVASSQDVIRIGQEYHQYQLDDWWPPLVGTMMGPDTFWNINDGSRDRIAAFAEWDRKWNENLSSQLGIRYERVSMDTGNVQGYFSTGESMWGMGLSDGSVYQADASAFNAREHKRTDNNLDLTATLRYVASANASYDIGLAQKTRSPNIYERYAWSNEASMAGAMISWFGDLNAYVGNLDLEPEIARTLRATADWHTTDPQEGSISLTPYVTHITNYIGVEVNNSTTLPAPPGRTALRFANHAADLYGMDISANKKLGKAYGIWRLTGIASYVAGRDTTNGTGLYNMMPPNIKATLENQKSNWTHTAEIKAVGSKNKLDTVRAELETPGYTLVNLRTRYSMKTWQVGASIDNALNRHYALPLGGVDFYQYNYLSSATNGHLAQTSGPGRSFNIDASISF